MTGQWTRRVHCKLQGTARAKDPVRGGSRVPPVSINIVEVTAPRRACDHSDWRAVKAGGIVLEDQVAKSMPDQSINDAIAA